MRNFLAWDTISNNDILTLAMLAHKLLFYGCFRSLSRLLSRNKWTPNLILVLHDLRMGLPCSLVNIRYFQTFCWNMWLSGWI